jgi:hypothetical protein
VFTLQRLLPITVTIGRERECAHLLENKKMVTLSSNSSKKEPEYLRNPVYSGKLNEVYYEINSNDYELESLFGNSIISISGKDDEPVREYVPRRKRKY